MKKTLLATASLGFLAVLGSGCGTNDPYSLLNQNAGDMLPALNLPVPTSASYLVRGFGTNGVDGFQFYNFGTYSSLAVIAPAAGTVEYLDTSLTPGFYAITIYHSPQLTTRISGMQSNSVFVGAYVNQGDTIGTMPTYTTSVAIQMDVYVNGGAATCPLSYMSTTARQTIVNYFQGANPCVQ